MTTMESKRRDDDDDSRGHYRWHSLSRWRGHNECVCMATGLLLLKLSLTTNHVSPAEDLMSLLCFTQMVTRNISTNHLIPGKVQSWSITSNGVPWLWLRMTTSLCFLLCELCHPACHPGLAQFQHHVKWIWKNVQRKLLLKQSCV